VPRSSPNATGQRPRARRLSPEARRQSIVDAAVDLIVQTGQTRCTLEQVATHAGISKPLIYRHFSSREALLEAVLDQELKALRGRGFESVPKNTPVARLIRGAVEQSLRYYFDHGPILRLLASDPAIADLARARNRSSLSSATDYLIGRYVREFGVPREIAVVVVTMTVNAPIHSMGYLRRQDVDIDQAIEVWSEFILGGWRALQRRFGNEADD